MADGIQFSMGCPQCGGALQSPEGEKVANCPYCRSLLYIEGDKGVFTSMFKNSLDEPRARGELARWLGKGLKARDLPQKAAITEVFPIYVPFWRLRARAAGWVCGYREERRRDSQGNYHTERIPMEVMVFRDFEWSEIACDPGDIGVTRLPGIAGEVLSHDEGLIPTFEPTTSPDDARGKGIEGVRSQAIASTKVPKITFQKMHVLPRYLGLVYYPIWVCRYTYEGRTYFATLDGVSARSLSGRAPGDPLYQALIGVGGAAGGGLITGLSAAGLVVWDVGEVAIIGLIVGVVVFVAGFLFFRHGSEVTEGDIAAGYKKGFKQLKELKNIQNLAGVR
jgi:hypothetical protein